jgi:acyl-CoA dehydrogenase family protein 9
MVKKLRNPFKNPTYMFEQMWKRYRVSIGNPALSIGIHNYLHPTLDYAAKSLEHCVARLGYATEILLQRRGANITDPKYQLELQRLADILIDVYAMTAVLSRASRSYCIGLHEAEAEVR